MLGKYKVPMPNQNLADPEIRENIAYFRWADTNIRPQGTTQPQPAETGTALRPGQTLSGGAPPGPVSSGAAPAVPAAPGGAKK